jgi:hypothetical protein
MDAFPWYGWIVGFGVLVWGAVAIIGTLGYGRRKWSSASHAGQSASAHDAVLTRLDAIDARLVAVEKTLNDIP